MAVSPTGASATRLPPTPSVGRPWQNHDVYDESGAWAEADDAALAYEALPGWHPAMIVDVFRTGLGFEDSVARQKVLSEGFVTPESIDVWGDFSRAQALFGTGLRISMTPLWARDAPDVAYVRLVETDEHFAKSMTDAPATAHVTLVWRPEIAVVPGTSWRLHHIGEPVPPDQVPRTAIGTDPRKLGDL